MDIRIKATDYQMTPAVRDYLDQRIVSLEKLLAGFEDTARIEVELGRDAGRPRHGANVWFAEIRIVCPGQSPVYARNNSESVNGAIDDVKEEVERQLRKNKRRTIRLTRRVGAQVKQWLWWGR